MKESDTRPWLPENYYRFAQVTEGLDQHYLFRRIVLGGFTGVSILGVLLQKPGISAGAVFAGGLAYLLLDPTFFVNIPGKRLYEEQKQLASKISHQEGWHTQDTSVDFSIKRIKSTITLTRELAPVLTMSTRPQTPLQRMKNFDNQLHLEATSFRTTDNWNNTVLSIARKALNIGESYWVLVGTNNAMKTAEAIKKKRAGLSREGHIGFQSKDIF